MCRSVRVDKSLFSLPLLKRIVAIGRELDARLLSLRHETKASEETSSCTSLTISAAIAPSTPAREHSSPPRWVTAWAARCELRRRYPVAAASLTKSELRRARARWDSGAEARAARAGANTRHLFPRSHLSEEAAAEHTRLPSPKLGNRRRERGRRLRERVLGDIRERASNGSDEIASTASSSLSFYSLMVSGLRDAHQSGMKLTPRLPSGTGTRGRAPRRGRAAHPGGLPPRDPKTAVRKVLHGGAGRVRRHDAARCHRSRRLVLRRLRQMPFRDGCVW